MQGVCELAARHGISQFELRSLEGVTDYPAFLSQSTGALDEAHRLLRAHGLTIPVVGASFHLTHSGEDDVAALLKTCAVADRLGAPCVRVFGGGEEGTPMTGQQVREAAKLFTLAKRRCREEGVRSELLVETHGGLVRAEVIEQFFDCLGRPAALLWDTHHTWKLGREQPAETFAVLGPHTRHLHVKDSVSRGDSASGFAYVLPGSCEFPFQDLFSLLEGLPTVNITLEWERHWHPELPPLDEALAAWKAYLEQLSPSPPR